jgi:hypothetical protein
MNFGVWPGNGVAFNPQLTTSPIVQNPLMTMIDGNGNLLIVDNQPLTAAQTTAAAVTPSPVSPTYGATASGVNTYWVAGSAPAWLKAGIYVLVPFSSQPQFIVSPSPGQVLAVGNTTIGGNPYYYFLVDVGGNSAIAQTPITSTTAEQYSGPPLLPANSAEGTTFNDGTVVWVVVAPMSQGFRVSPLPNASGPVYQITPYYQMLLEPMETLQSFIDPIPDDQKYVFQEGVEWMCKKGSPNPADRAEAMKMWPLWLKSLEGLLKQNDREPDAYGAIPGSSVVESVYGWRRNPQDPGQPY